MRPLTASFCSEVHLFCTQVEAKLIRRLSLAIFSWTECLKGIVMERGVSLSDTTMDTTPNANQLPYKLGGTPELEVCPMHELLLSF